MSPEEILVFQVIIVDPLFLFSCTFSLLFLGICGWGEGGGKGDIFPPLLHGNPIESPNNPQGLFKQVFSVVCSINEKVQICCTVFAILPRLCPPRRLQEILCPIPGTKLCDKCHIFTRKGATKTCDNYPWPGLIVSQQDTESLLPGPWEILPPIKKIRYLLKK